MGLSRNAHGLLSLQPSPVWSSSLIHPTIRYRYIDTGTGIHSLAGTYLYPCLCVVLCCSPINGRNGLARGLWWIAESMNEWPCSCCDSDLAPLASFAWQPGGGYNKPGGLDEPSRVSSSQRRRPLGNVSIMNSKLLIFWSQGPQPRSGCRPHQHAHQETTTLHYLLLTHDHAQPLHTCLRACSSLGSLPSLLICSSLGIVVFLIIQSGGSFWTWVVADY